MRKFDYIDLGSTLYTPAINKNLNVIANGEKFPYLTSVVFCLEDAIKEAQLQEAIKNIESFLKHYTPTKIKVFIRPRNIENFQQILQLENINKIDGFAFAKFGTQNMNQYFQILAHKEFYIMPVIESTDMFDAHKLKQIRDFLLPHKQKIITLRIGGEDMFKALSIKKECNESIHDFHISSKIFAQLLSIFKPAGFNLSAPVYNCLEHLEFFEKEVQRDIKEGFFGKTIIHPNQAKICNEVYKVTQKNLDEANQILNQDNEAIFRFEDKMCEPQAHNIWATNIVKRSKIFGIK